MGCTQHKLDGMLCIMSWRRKVFTIFCTRAMYLCAIYLNHFVSCLIKHHYFHEFVNISLNSISLYYYMLFPFKGCNVEIDYYLLLLILMLFNAKIIVGSKLVENDDYIKLKKTKYLNCSGKK